MCFRRRRVGALIVIAAAAFTLALTPAPGTAGSLDACAQRVIRDWFSGGRIDDAYPLACYRAALRALPDDVLQYSNADQDIRRALAFARRGRSDPGNQAVAAPTPKAAEKPSRPTSPATATPPAAATTPAATAPAAAATTPRPAPVANEAASPVSNAPIVADTRSPATSVPYPILALAALAGVLLVAGGVGWLAGRGR
jgi:cobalamin biosynthesis Mg chelatase CobN